MAGVRRRGTAGSYPRSAGPRSPRDLPGKAIQASMDSESRWTTASPGHCVLGRQNRSAGRQDRARTHLRGGLCRLQLWISAWPQSAQRTGRAVGGSGQAEGKLGARCGHSWVFRSRMLIPLLKTQLLELASPELLEQGYCLRFVREQVGIRVSMPGHLDRAIVNPVIDPVRSDLQFVGELRYGQEASNATRMGLAAHAEQAMT